MPSVAICVLLFTAKTRLICDAHDRFNPLVWLPFDRRSGYRKVMKRVMICGGPGSGKSTLARAMGARIGVPVYHMDHIHWLPGWVERPKAEKTPLVLEIVARDQWILEGGHSLTYPDRAARADTFIWLDMPVTLRLVRVVRRTIRDQGKTRPDMATGCREGFHHQTLPFWRWIWRTRHASRAKLAAIAADPGHLAVHHLRTRSQVARFIASLPTTKETER